MRNRLEALSFSFLLATVVGATGCPADETSGDGAGSPNDDDGDDDGTTTFNPADGNASNPSISDTGGGDGMDGPMDGMDGPMDEGMDDDSDGGFIEPPDGGVTGQCDPAAQDCPEGEKCTSYVSMPGGQTVDATKCVPSTGTAVAGEPCIREAENDDCDAGFFCMTEVSGNTGDGFCLEYCDIMTMQCEFGGECFAFNDGALPICQVTCDPLAPGCPDGQGCYAAFSNFVCAITGVGPEGGADGASCSTIQSCNPGLICRTGTVGCSGESGCCTPYCDLTEGPEQCPEATEECIAALDDPPPGLADVGFCGVPA